MTDPLLPAEKGLIRASSFKGRGPGLPGAARVCHVQRLGTDAPAPSPTPMALWFRLRRSAGRPSAGGRTTSISPDPVGFEHNRGSTQVMWI